MQTIAIDPGHGGDDVGARGSGGLLEKDVVLDIAHRLRALIETRLGIHVVQTREDDRAVPIDQRTAIANNNKAALFISLHANAAWSPAVSGAEVYHLRPDRTVAEVRLDAESSAITLPVLGGGTRTVDVIRWDLAQARHIDASARFATMLGAALGSKVPMSPRPVQAASLRVLEGADMPAVLVEVAYLTNPGQEKLAGSDAFKDGIAQAIFDTVAAFRSDQGDARTQ
jgi:N-acetylmuramoyl-L-alanine amidase